LSYVQSQSGVFIGLINTYKAMGGGWVTAAEATANAIDYPPPESPAANEETTQPATGSSGTGG